MTRQIKAAIIALAIASSAVSVNASGGKELPVTEVDGKEYYYYDVQPKETIFSLSQRLGMSREEIIEANPAVADGLKAYTRLYFPVDKGKVEIAPLAAGGQAINHTVQKRETLYGISKKYGVTVDRLIELNPQVRDGVKPGQVIVVSVAAEEPARPSIKVDLSNTKPYVIKDGETLYRIASENGITVGDLLSANPGLDTFNYSSGTEIRIPQAATATAAAPLDDSKPLPSGTPARNRQETAPSVDERESPADASEHTGGITASPATDSTPFKADNPSGNDKVTAIDEETVIPEELNIALMLPFMLSEETPSKSAMLFTDFYKGFLLAADTLSDSGKKVNIYAYDTANSLDTVKKLMKRPEMSRMNLIISPDDNEQLDYIISVTDSDRTFILNPFVVRDESYKDSPNVIQANIPHHQMYRKAVSAYRSQFGNRHAVFLSRIGGAADKEEFTSLLKTSLADSGEEFTEITYRDVLNDEDLSGLDQSKAYVFIPASGSRSEFIKIVPALKRFNETNGGVDGIAMFGYPEWVTFRGDMQDNLENLNAMVYSRFYNDENYYPSRRVADNFKTVYGQPMIASAPSQGIFGYDTGCYAINALRKNNGDFHLSPFDYDGLQSSFMMDDTDVDGLVNTSLLLLKFKVGGTVERVKL